MLKFWTLAFVATLVFSGDTPAQSRESQPSLERALLTKYCVTCHNEKLKTAGLSLQAISPDRVGPDAATWEKNTGYPGTSAWPLFLEVNNYEFMLDATSQDIGNGDQIQIWTSEGGDNQLWSPYPE